MRTTLREQREIWVSMGIDVLYFLREGADRGRGGVRPPSVYEASIKLVM